MTGYYGKINGGGPEMMMKNMQGEYLHEKRRKIKQTGIFFVNQCRLEMHECLSERHCSGGLYGLICNL